jgi:hypothetical protein
MMFIVHVATHQFSETRHAFGKHFSHACAWLNSTIEYTNVLEYINVPLYTRSLVSFGALLERRMDQTHAP